jgi:glucose/arabinose dehydrogenase
MRNVALTGMLLISAAAHAVSDHQFVVTNADIISWTLQSVSSPLVFGGATPALNNPAINLVVGARYQVTNVPGAEHPFQIIGKAVSAGSDVVLLSSGALPGSFESNPGVGWTDNLATSNTIVEFTATEALVAAMRTGGNVPGYRCGLHPTTMRGNFTIVGERIANPVAAQIPVGDITVELDTAAEGLVSPLGVAFPDDGSNRMFVHDQIGLVWVVQGGTRLATPFLDVAARLVTLQVEYDERGLLGFAVHPDFANHPQVYTYTTEPVGGPADFTVPISGSFNHQNVIAEWTVDSSNPNLIDPASRVELVRIDHPAGNHNGGTLHFGPDGYLYFSVGDGGQSDDQGDGHAASGNAQDKGRILGKILRIDADGGGTPSANGRYGIPNDNPFLAEVGAVREIYAYGFRNPYQFSFDSLTGGLYVGDAGQNAIEEVDLVTLGGNYGWRIKEGSFFFNPNGDLSGFVTDQAVVFPVPPDLIDPIAEYDHDDGTVVVGGCVYRGAAIAALQGRYVFGEFGTSFSTPSGRLLYLDAANQIKELIIGLAPRPLGVWIKGFARDLDGNVYVCGSEQLGPSGTTGTVLKLRSVAGIPPFHSADQTQDNQINLTELLRVIQFFNTLGYHCVTPPATSEDGYLPGPGTNQTCAPHDSDYNPQNWQMNLSELLRLIQFFNIGGYLACLGQGTEDGYCPGL